MSLHFGSIDTQICDRHLNLLAHAQSVELDIGSLCGGQGRCGGDLVRIKDPRERALLSAVTDDEKRHLSTAMLKEGWRLACQCYPEKNDGELHVEFKSPTASLG